MSDQVERPSGLGCSEGLGPLPPLPTPSDPHRIGARMCAFNSADMEAYAKTAMEAMRERCAQIAEGAQRLPNDGQDFANGWCSAALQIAQAIRA